MRTEHNETENRIDLFDDNAVRVGMIEYTHGEPGRILAVHTYVFLGYEGKGYATLLLDALTDYARASNIKISPVCSFVKQAFSRNPKKYAGVEAI